jgi:hypothetical protein
MFSTQENLHYSQFSNFDENNLQPQQHLFSQKSTTEQSQLELFDGDNNINDNYESDEEKCLSPAASTIQSALTLNLIDENADFSSIPETVLLFYKEIKQKYSDWAFIAVIAGQLTINSFPMGAYHNLKLALLMSLVSTSNTENSSMLHIVAIGEKTLHACKIMMQLGKFAERFMFVSNNFDDICVHLKTHEIECGPIALGSNGISFIGNWERLTQKNVLKYLREIETGKISVDSIQRSFPLETTIWTYWTSSNKVKKDTASIDQFLK